MRTSKDRLRSVAMMLLAAVAACGFVRPAELLAASASAAQINEAINRAADFLKQAQADDGSFSSASGPGVTAIVTAGLLRAGRTANDPVVARALKYLEANRHDDGGVYQTGGNHKNYETCLAIIAFQEANKDHKYDQLLAAAEKFIKKEQWDEDENKSPDDLNYGG